MIKSKILIFLMTALLFCAAVFGAVKESADDRPLFAVVYSKDQAEELSPVYISYYGILYVFLPSHASLDQVQLRTPYDGAYQIGGYTIHDGMSCEVFQLNEPYPISGSEDLPYSGKELRFVHSGGVASMFLDVHSGNMNHLHADKKHSESGQIRLYSPDGSLLFSGRADSISGRGQSSWQEEKKSYNVTLQAEADLLGLGAAKRWVLQSNAKDPSNLRNKVIMDTANLAGIQYTPDSQWVDLYLNGEYAGLYLLCEKIEIHPQRVDIPTAGSFLVSKDASWRFGNQGDPHIVTDSNAALGIVHADVSHAALESIWQSVENAILAEDGIDPVTGKSWDELIDAQSWARKYLLEELFGNIDALSHSQYYYLDSSRQDGRIAAGPAWDYDLTMMGRYNEYYAANRNLYGSKWVPALYEKPEFYQIVQEEYSRIFQPLMYDLMENGLFQYASAIKDATSANALRWNHSADADYVREFTEYLQARVSLFNSLWLEEHPYIHARVFGYDDSVWDLAYPAGSLISDLPDYSQLDGIVAHGWYHYGTEIPFDPNVPVSRDIAIEYRYDPIPHKTQEESQEPDQVPRSRFLAVLAFLMMLVLIFAADFVRSRQNPRSAFKPMRNSEESYETP